VLVSGAGCAGCAGTQRADADIAMAAHTSEMNERLGDEGMWR